MAEIILEKAETFQERLDREWKEKMKNLPKANTPAKEGFAVTPDEKYQTYIDNKEKDKERYQKIKPRTLQTPEQEEFNKDPDF